MTRQTQTILYHLLPVVFWLLAIGGSMIPLLLFHLGLINSSEWTDSNYWWAFAVTALSLLSVIIVHRIPRHTDSIEQCFQVALLLGIASYWLLSVLFLIIPVWFYLIYRNLFSFRAFLATLIGLAVVAVWIVVLNQLSIINYQLSITKDLWFWLPTGAFLLAYIASAIARQILQIR